MNLGPAREQGGPGGAAGDFGRALVMGCPGAALGGFGDGPAGQHHGVVPSLRYQ